MLENYFKIAIRNIKKHKFYSAINISGLVIGMACCLLIFVYVKDELSYDRFHHNVDNMYRVGLHGKIAGQEIYTTNSCLPLGPTMQDEIPGVESMTRLNPFGRNRGVVFKYEEKIFSEFNIHYADSNFFEFFSFELVAGDKATALKEPNSVVITEALAKKYFDSEPLGKMLVIGNGNEAFKVTGIAKEAPGNSHLKFSALLSFATILDGPNQIFAGWTGNSLQTYVTLNPQTKLEEVNAKLEDMVAKYVGKELEQGLGISFDEFQKQGGIYSYVAYPLADSHLRNRFPDDMEPSSDIRYVYIFSGIGIFILLLACINFMNLSTAQSAGRAKEVGLRKTLGSQRGQMVWQFLSESLVYSFIAVIISVLFCYAILPYFNLLSGKQLNLDALRDPIFFVSAAGLVLLVGFLAGSYPAIYLTSFNVAEVLKGKVRGGMKTKGVRSSLVVFQFAVSIFLIIATLVVYLQIDHMQNKNMGLDQRNVLVLKNVNRLNTQRLAFKDALLGQSGVLGASYANNTFPGANNINVFRAKGVEVDHLLMKYYADWDHEDVLKFTMKKGRFLSKDFASDSMACVINEAAMREFGWTDSEGKEIIDFNYEVPQTIKVVGVVEDFNFESLKKDVMPVLIRLTDQSSNLYIRYSGSPQEIITAAEGIWKRYAPGDPFEYVFLDENFDTLFREEQRLRDIFTVFSSLAIAIACLGLFALAAFTTEQRTKEIGIRKALGASVVNLSILLSKEFVILVLIALIPAIGLGWYLANWWLSDFPYRIELSPLIFICSAILSILIAWLTVSYQSIKAASAKPVDSLRYE
jgi:putative ABC transport system permease protein